MGETGFVWKPVRVKAFVCENNFICLRVKASPGKQEDNKTGLFFCVKHLSLKCLCLQNTFVFSLPLCVRVCCVSSVCVFLHLLCVHVSLCQTIFVQKPLCMEKSVCKSACVQSVLHPPVCNPICNQKSCVWVQCVCVCV